MPDSTNIRPRLRDARPTRLLCAIVAVALALLVEAGSLRANVVSGATAVDGLIFSWQYDLSGGAGFVLIENVAHNLGGPPSDIGLVDMLPRSATNILVGPQMEDYACVSSAVVLQNVLNGQTPGNAAVVTFNFPAAAVTLVERPVGERMPTRRAGLAKPARSMRSDPRKNAIGKSSTKSVCADQ